jgi:hypothetical protein
MIEWIKTVNPGNVLTIGALIISMTWGYATLSATVQHNRDKITQLDAEVSALELSLQATLLSVEKRLANIEAAVAYGYNDKPTR